MDAVLIQEPYVGKDLPSRRTKKHPAYNCFTPTETWHKTPRVLTYVRKDSGTQAHLVTGPWTPNRDLLLLHLNVRGLSLLLLNVYNAPPGSDDPGQGLDGLLAWNPLPFRLSSPETSP